MSTTRKREMSEIMNLAWSFIRMNGYTMSEALFVAWRNFNVRKAMHTRIVKFYFRKIDGSVRLAFGTLKSDIVPPTGSERKPNPTVQVYYDTEKQSWRCFKRSQLLSIA